MNYLGISIIVVRNGKLRNKNTFNKNAFYSSLDEVYQAHYLTFMKKKIDIQKVFCVQTK